MEEEERPPPLVEPCGRYVREVATTVAQSFRLNSGGQPARWALEALHDDITGRIRDQRLTLLVSPRTRDEDLSLTLELTPNRIGVQYRFGEQRAPDTPKFDDEYDFCGFGVGYGADHWAALEQQVFDIIRAAIGVMREDIQARYPARNPTSLTSREKDLGALLQVLFHKRRPTDQAETARLRRLAEMIAIDLPGRRQEPDPEDSEVLHKIA
jgi:hypothetical protein